MKSKVCRREWDRDKLNVTYTHMQSQIWRSVSERGREKER
jgi:hypothetical protein